MKPSKAQRLALTYLANEDAVLKPGRARIASPRILVPGRGCVGLVPRQTFDVLVERGWLRKHSYRFGWDWAISNEGRAAIGLEPLS